MTPQPVRVAAVDLGCHQRPGDGRPGRCATARPGGAAPLPQRRRAASRGRLYWDVLGIHREVLDRHAEVARTGPLHGIGIDSWAVDYGLLDRDGQLLGNPRSHRDAPHRRRTRPGASRASARAELYDVDRPAAAAVQHRLPAGRRARHRRAGVRRDAAPAARTCWPTGSPVRSEPSAPTRRPPGCTTYAPGDWALDLAKRLGLPWSILPPLRDPGAVVGPLLPEVGEHLGVAGRPGHRGRLARHRLGGRRRAGRGRRASPTSRPAPGRWSAWSSRRRCSRRRPARPTSPTRAASTARSASSRT